MNIRSTILLLCLTIGTSFAAEPLGSYEIKKILAEDHDDKPLVEALKIYPKARAYEMTIKLVMADDQKTEHKGSATEKWVGGKYIVSRITPAGADMFFDMLVEYDAASKTYRKYVIFDGKLTGYMVGTRAGKTRSISWIDLTEEKLDPNVDALLSVETHTDDATSWKSIYFSKGAIHHTEDGVAKVKK